MVGTLLWADPWGERKWEEPSDADESAVLVADLSAK